MSMNKQEADVLAAQAVIIASKLAVGSYVAQISLALLMLGLLPWLFGYPVSDSFLFSAIALALLQGYFAVRVSFDANIFHAWAQRWYGDADPQADLRAFDRRIGRKTASSATLDVDMASRCHGALRLLRLQVVSLALQLLMTAVALWS
jgi:hypothetical protein